MNIRLFSVPLEKRKIFFQRRSLQKTAALFFSTRTDNFRALRGRAPPGQQAFHYIVTVHHVLTTFKTDKNNSHPNIKLHRQGGSSI